MNEAVRRGREAEDRVQAAFERRGYRLLRKRWRTPVAEIDLLMRSSREFLLIEVKTLSRRGFDHARVSRAQRARLWRAQRLCQDRLRADVRLVIAFVQDDGKILLFNPTEDDLH